jgi:tRNA G18 (ribose-2'-O)-methylase SpoU
MSELEPHFAGVPRTSLPPRDAAPVHVVVDNVRSAFNVGSIFRTSDAGRVAHIHLCGVAAHPPHFKLEKTALGAFDYVPWTYYERTEDCISALRAQGIAIAGIEVTPDARPLHRVAWPQPVAIVFGHEVYGIKPEILEQCDFVVKIPMHGHKNSINVATAFGVVLYAILNQWNALD